MSNRELRLGAIGLGRAASSMLPSLGAHPHVRLAAAADPNSDARARFAADYGGATFASAEELCASGTVDAVYIATPHQLHADNVAVAASHGLHCIVEKPMALSVEECRAMVASAEAAGIVLIVGHTHAYDPSIVAMRRVIESGELGRLRQLTNLVYTDFLYRPRRSEELDSSLGGGIMYNQVPHQIEIARALDGRPIRSVRAIAGIWDPRRKTEGALTALIEFVDGVAASLVYSSYDRFISDEFAFNIGESGNDVSQRTYGYARASLGMPDLEEEARMKAASGYGGGGVRSTAPGARHQPHFGMLLVSCEGGDMRPSPDGILIYDNAGVREIVMPPGRAYPNKDGVIDEFYAAVVDGVTPLHDGTWGMRTVETMLALVQSSAERREISLYRKYFPDEFAKRGIDIAEMILNRKISYFEGCRELTALRAHAFDSDTPLLFPFVGIASESDGFPVGKERKLWNAKALAELDVRIKNYGRQVRKNLDQNCRKLIHELWNSIRSPEQ